MTHFPVSRRLQGAILVLLAIAASGTTLPNQFNQDDIPIILTNEGVHQLRGLWHAFAEPYWPPPFPPELYRPVAIVLFGLQWAIGDGAPIVFRLASLVLYVLATLLVWRLGVRLVGNRGGWVAAALFAVHPVHVEAVAVAVNQGELLVAIALLWATDRYLEARAASLRVPPATALAIVAATTVAMFAKETAVVLPGILILAELTVLRDAPLRQRLGAVRPVVLGLVLATVTMGAIRDRVLEGDLKGTFTAESIANQDMRGRAMTMAGVVPDVVRLLVWPEHLRADYTPQEVPPATAIGPRQTVGIAITAALVVAGLLALRFAPPLAFALGWVVIGYFPVSNVLVPSGIVLAERTLFLPSVGVVLLAGLLTAAWPMRRPLASAGIGLVLGALILGVARSASRHTVWRDQAVLIRQTLIDAPLAYRPHRSMAKMLFNVDEVALGERYYREALRLYPPLHVAGWELADEYRKRGLCEPAIPLYQRALEIQPDQPGARAAYLACLAWLGDFAAAREQATAGMAFATRRELFARWRAEVRAAELAGVGPRTLRLTAPPADPNERRVTW